VQRIRLTQGDQLPFVQATLEDANGNPIDLAVATVRFHMVTFAVPHTVVVDAPANILQSGAINKGLVQYNWQPQDTVTPGLFTAYFVITQGSIVQHFPPDNQSFLVQIFPLE
jgi:hypothetical protein